MHNKWMCTRRKGGAKLRPTFATRGGQFPLNVKLPAAAAAFSSLRSFLSCSNTHSLCVHTRNHNRQEHLQLIYSICYNSECGKKINWNVPAGFQVSREAPAPSDRPCETLSPTPQGRCPLDTRTRRHRPNSPAIFLARNHLRTHTRDIQISGNQFCP